jgi:alkylated DNA repair dioxygenase AlkB
MARRPSLQNSAQAGLFDPPERVLVDDADGRISYSLHLLTPLIAQECFAAIHANTPWNAERRQMYDRMVDVPRLTCGYALAGELPSAIATIAQHVRQATRVEFTHVGLNLYRDGRDSVAPHNDHLDELAPDQPIALVSLGAAREMVIRAKAPPHRVMRLELEAGSLLMMSHTTQLHYDHGIPKQDVAVGPRISLAFRVRRAVSAAHFYR